MRSSARAWGSNNLPLAPGVNFLYLMPKRTAMSEGALAGADKETLAMTDANLLNRLPERCLSPGPDELFRQGLRLSTPGSGIDPDQVTAHALFDLAARGGSIEARIYRRELEEDMDRAQIKQAQAIARAWLASGHRPTQD